MRFAAKMVRPTQCNMTDTNNGRSKMITNTLALFQNVPGETVDAVKAVQIDNR